LARVGHFKTRFKGPRVAKKAQLTHERVEYNVFLFDEPFKGFKSFKTFKIKLTFRFDKLWHLSKSVHIGENFQILTVSNKKRFLFGMCWRGLYQSLFNVALHKSPALLHIEQLYKRLA
jgi:hypothetical protein